MFVYAYTYVYVCVYACVYVFYKFCSLQRILLQRLNSGKCKVNYKRCMSNDQMSSERSQRDVEETRKRSVEMVSHLIQSSCLVKITTKQKDPITMSRKQVCLLATLEAPVVTVTWPGYR